MIIIILLDVLKIICYYIIMKLRLYSLRKGIKKNLRDKNKKLKKTKHQQRRYKKNKTRKMRGGFNIYFWLMVTGSLSALIISKYSSTETPPETSHESFEVDESNTKLNTVKTILENSCTVEEGQQEGSSESNSLFLKNPQDSSKQPNKFDSFIVIGDMHGVGIAPILYRANLTASPVDCTWRPGSSRVVQLGDFTDRGNYALEDHLCLQKLQATSQEMSGEKVVTRLLGNHEIMVMEGDWSYAASVDTSYGNKRLKQLSTSIQADILNGNIQATLFSNGILFSHAGLHSNHFRRMIQEETFKNYVALYTQRKGISATDETMPQIVSEYINEKLRDVVASQPGQQLIRFTGPLFDNGEIRGGPRGSIGGPFWADKMEHDGSPSIPGIKLQAVGHTVQRGPPQRQDDILFLDTGMSPSYGGMQGISKIALTKSGGGSLQASSLTFQIYDSRGRPKDVAVIKL